MTRVLGCVSCDRDPPDSDSQVLFHLRISKDSLGTVTKGFPEIERVLSE